MKLTPVDPRNWDWEVKPAYRVDIWRDRQGSERAADEPKPIPYSEEYLISVDTEDVRAVIAHIESMLTPGDTFDLFASIPREGRHPGLMRLMGSSPDVIQR